MIRNTPPVPTLTEAPRWLEIAYGELGTAEIAGEKDNPRILEYFKHTTIGPKVHDETAWCSAFVNFCVDTAGFDPTRLANARSWQRWGSGLIIPRVGAITVFNRPEAGPAAGHVAFFISQTPQMITVLGGNQHNRVCIGEYPRARLIGYRWTK
jgi:uncharacterized protein (TIGR02594 family)